jgi:hypothetical protein
MCFFISIGIATKHADVLAREFGRGYQLHPTTNPSFRSLLKKDETSVVLTSGSCSCDLYSLLPNQRKGQPSFVGLRPDCRQKIAKVAKEASGLALLAHFYSCSVEDERFAVEVGKAIPVAKAVLDQTDFPPDTLIRIKA